MSTQTLLNDFARVRKGRLCPICGKGDWCLISREMPAVAAVCTRIESQTRWGDAGWHHRLTLGPPRFGVVRTASVTFVDQGSSNLSDLATQFQRRARPDMVDGLARDLGVQGSALRRLLVGWTGREWSFPMVDVGGTVRGIRLRRPDGSKLAVKGGREGLFVPNGRSFDGPLLAAEGATDTAALLGLGFDTVGRPSCSGGTTLLVKMVTHQRVESVVVFADADESGRRGSRALATVLSVYCCKVRVVCPPEPFKDAREWIAAGACRADVEHLIDAAKPIALSVVARRWRT